MWFALFREQSCLLSLCSPLWITVRMLTLPLTHCQRAVVQHLETNYSSKLSQGNYGSQFLLRKPAGAKGGKNKRTTQKHPATQGVRTWDFPAVTRQWATVFGCLIQPLFHIIHIISSFSGKSEFPHNTHRKGRNSRADSSYIAYDLYCGVPSDFVGFADLPVLLISAVYSCQIHSQLPLWTDIKQRETDPQ